MVRRAKGATRQQVDITAAEHPEPAFLVLDTGITLWVDEDVEGIEFKPTWSDENMGN